VILGVVVAVIAVADQWSKSWVASTLGPGSDQREIEIVPSVLRFFYVENTGAAFGMFRDNAALLLALSVIVVAALLVLFFQMIVASRLLGFAFGLQFGGAAGNMVDRMRLGYVVDFIDVPRFPTFNVADSAITVGVVLLAYVLLVRPIIEHRGQEKQENQPIGQRATIEANGSSRRGDEVALEADRDRDGLPARTARRERGPHDAWQGHQERHG
jgi:signal peptidase II